MSNVDIIFNRLLAVSTSKDVTDRDKNLLRAIIIASLNEGWTATEIFRYLLLCEEVSPHLEEDMAIRGMNRIRQDVNTRLGK
jgi:hypothetical protein